MRQDWKVDSLNSLARRVFNTAKKHGFHKRNENVSEKLMLIVSELGEACEALRRGKRFSGPASDLVRASPVLAGTVFEHVIKDTFEDELADVIIRALDLACSMGIDIDFHVREKMLYNEGRPFRHGKLF